MKTNNTLDYDNLPNFKFFYEISKIPRKSFHEEEIADFIERFAIDNNLWYRRDALGNIIIKKPATYGKEDSEPIILQAHLDMVCEKIADSDHDFSKDPIDIYIEDGWMKAVGTTLGADDGAGVANILGILSETDIMHPPLECVFTVQEEDGMGGAKNLDFSLLTAKRMIGLDGIKEGTTIFSASGVIGGKIVKKLDKVENTNVYNNTFEIIVTGLTSGHGALNIGNGQANAIKLSGRLLYHLNKKFGIRLCSINGGTLVHVIPRECRTVFKTDKSIDENEIIKMANNISAEIKNEYAGTDPEINIICRKTEIQEDEKEIAASCSNEIINLLYLIPCGVSSRNHEHLDRVEGSWNLSTARTYDDKVVFDEICRANAPANVKELASLVTAYTDAFNAVYEERFNYCGYRVSENSPLTQIWADVYRKHTGKELERMYIHSALDAGTIYEGLNKIDIIVVMPTVMDVHTPKERMDVDSFARTYQYLKDILANA